MNQDIGRLSINLSVGETLVIHDAHGTIAEIQIALRANGGMRLRCSADQSIRFHRAGRNHELPKGLKRLAARTPVRSSERRTG